MTSGTGTAMARRVLMGLAGCVLLLSCCAVFPGGPPALAVAAKPNPPQGVSGQAGGRQLTISWLVFSDDGWGGPIDKYVITVITPAGQVQTKYATTSPVTFTGLRHGTYSYYVGAHNADGWGHVSPTAMISVPSEPDRMAVPHASSVKPDTLTVTWTPPGSDGESPITGYQVRFDGIVHDVPASTLQATFPARGGTEHTVQVRAGNRWGFGEFSGTHHAHALGAPGPVQSVSATATDRTIAVTWTPPKTDGGRTIDHYRVKVFSGAVSQEKPGTDRADFVGLEPDNDWHVSVTPVGYVPGDGLGPLEGPAYTIGVHTAAEPPASSTSPGRTTSTAPTTLPGTTKTTATTTIGSSTATGTTATAASADGSGGPGVLTATSVQTTSSVPTGSVTASPVTASVVPDSSSATRSDDVGGAAAAPRTTSVEATMTGEPRLPGWIWWAIGCGALAVVAALALMLAVTRRSRHTQ
jgi:titin